MSSGDAMPVVRARGLSKRYGRAVVLDKVDLEVAAGRIVGLIGSNGAGKSTALNAILGLVRHSGELAVLGRDPWTARGAMMRDVCFIADVAVMPRWMRVAQALDYVGGVHPRFDHAKAERLLEATSIRRSSRVGSLSKGMVAQLHLALILAIDARLLVLDEPTLGLDILYRRQFYDTLLNDYFDADRTILVTTHQVEEIQHILTDLIIIDHGRIVLDCEVDTLEARFTELRPGPAQAAEARALGPVHERRLFGESILLFDGTDRQRLSRLGAVRTPTIADLFVALVGGPGGGRA